MAQEDVRHDDSSNVPLHPPQPRPPSSPPKSASPSAAVEAAADATPAVATPAAPVANSVTATTESAELPPLVSPSTPAPSSAAAAAPSRSSAASPSTVAALTTVSATVGGAAAAAAPVAPASAASPNPAAAAPGTADHQQNGDSRGHESKPDSDMSSQHPGAPHGQPMGYPAQSPYPTATSMSTAQYASYPTSQPGDAYRAGPVVSSSMSLPSMRTIDSMPQPSAPMGHPHGLPMNMGMPSVPGGMPFYGHHGVAMSPGYGLPADAMARYPLPHDPRLMGHRGPKKEIKRRTKTGCLTCRKRRIKCDETHPTCNNCKKSKRECLGYDPIFRQQAGSQSNSNIQPAPSSQPTTPVPVPSSVPSSIPSSLTSSGPANSAVGIRPSNSYGSQPSMLPSAYGTSQASNLTPSPATTSLSYDPTVSVVTPTSAKSEPGYEYSSAIDPALQTLPSTSHTSIHHQDGSRSLQHKPLLDNLHLRARKMKIDEIIDLLGPAPPFQQIGHSEETFNEITKVYHEMYAGGLSAFFETSWYYFVDNGKMAFPRDVTLVEHMASFLKILEAVKANDHTQMASSGILETRIVWELARTVYQTPDKVNSSGQALPPDGDAAEARNRVRVVEALLCGEYLDTNPLAPPVQDIDPHRTRQFDFWYNLAEFVRQRDSPNEPGTVQVREEVLSRMRLLLDGRENRDVLYSVAVVRELAPKFDPGYGSTLPQHLDETDPKNRLAVASKFILDESQVTGGTTNVVRRFSDIASRAFVNPGVNIARTT